MKDGRGLYVVIAAAGIGERLGIGMYKALIKIGEKAMVQWAIEAFDEIEEVDFINVVVPYEANIGDFECILEGVKRGGRIGLIYGGSKRQLSVYRGVKAFECNDDSVILVHDAARPFVSSRLIKDIINEMSREDVVVPIIPVTDTIKMLKSGYVISTLPREEVGFVQTPQAFKFGVYKRALEIVDIENDIFTDEASIFERAGIKVRYVEGERSNIKITYKEDLLIAEALAKKFKQKSMRD
jgi:2-C-methyl-D-erythritol 4-phosphate cytidylyltransferase